MPGPVRAVVVHQPVTSIVNSIRHHFAEQPLGTGISTAMAWMVGIVIVAQLCAMTIDHRKISYPTIPDRGSALHRSRMALSRIAGISLGGAHQRN